MACNYPVGPQCCAYHQTIQLAVDFSMAMLAKKDLKIGKSNKKRRNGRSGQGGRKQPQKKGIMYTAETAVTSYSANQAAPLPVQNNHQHNRHSQQRFADQKIKREELKREKNRIRRQRRKQSQNQLQTCTQTTVTSYCANVATPPPPALMYGQVQANSTGHWPVQSCSTYPRPTSARVPAPFLSLSPCQTQ
ncbi:uncharacterized protein [Prorops nasuta]|uniref:uncharacterized protein isoform X2 n=1 Tax=Prorops nasuta TaxID=863751 RepID=UPI0034CEAECD